MPRCVRDSAAVPTAPLCRSCPATPNCRGARSTCRRRTAASRETLADAVAADERAGRFDLARPPLLRCALVRLGAEHCRLVLTFHHIVADGWSLPVLHRELMAYYGTPDPGLPEVTPYADHLARLARQDRDAARDAWRAALARCRRADAAGRDSGGRHRPGARPGPGRAVRRDHEAADRTCPRARRHPRHRGPGRVGSADRQAHRTPGRGVRHHRLGPGQRGRRHRVHGGPVHQHPSHPVPLAGRRVTRSCCSPASRTSKRN